jgi:septal ring factor EnvC (AmiA/AmiB activator)
MLVAQNQELEAELEDERVQKAELEEALAEAKAEKVALGEQIRTLEQEIQKLQAAGDARSGIVAELERLFDTHRGALREPRQPQV